MSTAGDLRDAGTVAVVRGGSLDAARTVARAALAAGVQAVEVTYTVPDADLLIAELAAEGVLVGAGTVTRRSQVAGAAAAGARFAVSPVSPAWLCPDAEAAGLLAVPGCATPGEIWAAGEFGAELIKVFPIGRLGGPAYVRDLLGPFPDLQLMASGGVSPAEFTDYRAAGVACIGVNGRSFLPHDT